MVEPYVKPFYGPEHKEVAFPLGGIGTGNISIGSRGQLKDWEIFNAPGKGNYANYTFFALYTKPEGEVGSAKVLESRILPSYLEASTGYPAEKYAGLPRFADSRFSCEYPFAQVELIDEEEPVHVTMEAFTPFIPLDADDSGIPGFILRYKVKNKLNKKVKASIAGSISNITGFTSNSHWGYMQSEGTQHNEKRVDGDIKGLYLYNTDVPDYSVKYGNLSLLTKEKDVTIKAEWFHDAWWDGIHLFWQDFSQDGRLKDRDEPIGLESQKGYQTNKVGSICVEKDLEAFEEKTFEFVLTWYIPNRPSIWKVDAYTFKSMPMNTIKNHYATLFEDSWHVGKYMFKHMERLEGNSRLFTEALYTSTLPQAFMEAVANNISVIRSTTCYRIDGGHFLAWEGSHDREGSCPGTCTHVWNYAQTLAFLFPSLERSARHTEFMLEINDEGKMTFRTQSLLAGNQVFLHSEHAAADGQLGTILRLYREWKLCGDDDFLRELWPKAKKALDYAFEHWDSDGDLVLDHKQHNTYDIEFYGPNSMVNSVFYGALKAGEKMADYLGDYGARDKYKEAHEIGSKRMDSMLWNGEYYCQQLDDVNALKYQYGQGCLADQLFGQTLAHICGLGYVLPEAHVKKAIKAVYDYNFRESLKKHVNVQRTYALNDEGGLLLCTWPHGGRPILPFVYCDEVWSGIEYQVATHLIYEGYVEEAYNMMVACRSRYNGIARNPYSDIECGHHYARSLGSWGLLIALSGFGYDLSTEELHFDPAIKDKDFKCFWSSGKEWGTYTRSIDKQGRVTEEKEVLYTK